MLQRCTSLMAATGGGVIKPFVDVCGSWLGKRRWPRVSSTCVDVLGWGGGWVGLMDCRVLSSLT